MRANYNYHCKRHVYVLLILMFWVLSIYPTVSLFGYDPYADDEFEEKAPLESPVEKESQPEVQQNETFESSTTVNSFTGPSDMPAPLTGPEYVTPFWDNTRLSLVGSGLFNFGDISENLPFGFSGLLAYEATPYLGWIPEMRLEMGYRFIGQNQYTVHGPTAAIGLIWLYAPSRSHVGRLQAMLMPGFGYFSLQAEDQKSTAAKFITDVALGYEYPFGDYFAYGQARYQYIYDAVASLNGVGIMVGFGMHLKASPAANKGGG